MIHVNAKFSQFQIWLVFCYVRSFSSKYTRYILLFFVIYDFGNVIGYDTHMKNSNHDFINLNGKEILYKFLNVLFT